MNSIDISGLWNYALDADDEGINKEWYKHILNNSGFKLPGTTAENKAGEELVMDAVMNKDTVHSLRQRYKYVGAAWYQRFIEIPKEWDEKKVFLFLERVMFQSKLWIDDKEIGISDSLSTPHSYDITNYIRPGNKHTLTLRIDNRDVQNIGTFPSAFTDETQTIWNGIIGKIELQARDKVYIKNIKVFSHIKNKKIKIETYLENCIGHECDVSLSINFLGKKYYNFSLKKGSSVEEFEIDFEEGTELWDEFTPNLYNLSVKIEGEYRGDKFAHEKSIRFGIREFKCNGTQFSINCRKTFLRGTLDCCIYPLTGYPPTDVNSWIKVFNTVKEYGLNHVRFHSWCPPEAAFEAADEIGIYLNVEGPMWMDSYMPVVVGKYPEHYSYLLEEAKRVIDTYGNHPSFCMYSNGNELNGDFNLLHDIIAKLKEEDKRIVYTLTTNWDRKADEADDYFAAQTVDGVGVRGQFYHDKMIEGTELDFEEAVRLREIPIVAHEVGQYSVYPDVDEITKYSGVLRPVNFEAIRNDLKSKGMLKDARNFVLGSGKLALSLYKEEIEASLRTKGLGGFQLLDLHDFPGQSTATVGILNSFWESKGIAKPKEFRKFCAPVVLLLRMPKRIYRNNECFTAEVEIANFGEEVLKNKIVEWCIQDKHNNIISTGKFSAVDIEISNGIKVGKIVLKDFISINEPSKLKISIHINDTDISNEWNIWIYPKDVEERLYEIKTNSSIIITDKYDAETEEKLLSGENILLFPNPTKLKEAYPGRYFPVFWSPVHFISKDPCGILCHNSHPVFEHFPTEFYSEPQWKSLLENSTSICIDSFPEEYTGIVQVIPNFFNNHRLGNIFEARVGKGKILISSMDLLNNDSLEAKQLLYSILKYMNSDKFNPKYELDSKHINSLFN